MAEPRLADDLGVLLSDSFAGAAGSRLSQQQAVDVIQDWPSSST